MNFLVPLAFFGLIALPLVVLMYLLKLKRRRVTVPSTLLWRRSVQDLVANAPFQKLRNNLLLYLQLLILALLVIALARPTMMLQGLKGETVVLLMDISASMQAREPGGRARLELAREAALKLIESLAPGDRMILVTFGDKTQVVQTVTSNKDELRRAVRSLEAADTTTDLREAVFILQDLTTMVNTQQERVEKPDTRTVIISDGALGPTAELLAEIPKLEYVRVGESTNNQGITDLDVRPSFSGTFEFQVFANVFNAAEEEAERFVELNVNGEVLDLKRVVLKPGETQAVVFTTAERLRGLAQVTLQGEDALAADDTARGLLSAQEDVRVLLVTSGNVFLEKVFNVTSNVQVSRIAPSDYEPRADFDLTVFEEPPAKDPPPGNYLFINCAPAALGFQIAEPPLERPVIFDWNRIHPLTRFVNLEKIIIQRALRVEPPDTAILLAESEQAPMLMLYEKDLTRALVIPFALLDSDWPLQASFPIFIANALDYFSRSLRTTAKPLYRTGEIVPVYTDKVSNSVTVRDPRGEAAQFPLDEASTVYYTGAQRIGVYEILYDKGKTPEYFTVNLLSQAESNIRPVETLQIGARALKGQTEVVRVNREVWPWFLAVALGFLCVEWWIYCRRSWL